MQKIDELMVEIVERHGAPFIVAAVANSGRTLWEGTNGAATSTRAAQPDTLFRLFSMTKAIGSLAAMILVDRGMMELDSTVESVLPEFGDIRVLESLGEHGPVLRPARRPVTLRHLLTHTSGLGVGTFNRKQAEWENYSGPVDALSGTRASLEQPLLFDPGCGFAYGWGIDWAGLMIERLDGRSVDHFCRDEIFEPLGMTDATFEPGPARDRLADLKFRNGSGEFIDYDLSPPSSPEVYRLGSALYGTSRDYIRFVRMILNNGELDGNRVVTPSSLNAMTINQIGELSVEMKTTAPDRSVDVDLLFGTRITHTIGFMRNEENIPGMRDAGSLGWAGVANTHYWIDPAKDIAAVFMTQLLPFCDPRLMNFYHEFERAVYERFVGASNGPGAARPKVGEAGR